jgi:hypothetical protein
VMGMVLLNSRKGSVQMIHAGGRRAAIAHRSRPLTHQTNGYGQGHPSPQQLAAGLDVEQTAPGRPTPKPEKR